VWEAFDVMANFGPDRRNHWDLWRHRSRHCRKGEADWDESSAVKRNASSVNWCQSMVERIYDRSNALNDFALRIMQL